VKTLSTFTALVIFCTAFSPGGGNIVTQAKARLAKLAKPTDAKGKPTSTPKWKRGERIWIISCDQTLVGCSLPAASTQKAVKVVGWKVTVFDGKSNPALYAQGVNQAIAAGADAIILDSTDCNFVKAPLEQARRAHIVVFGYDVIDCSDPGAGGGKRMLDFTALPKGYKTYPQFIRDWGRMKADYLIAKTNGHAKVITSTERDILSIDYEGQAIRAELAKCSGCKVVANVDFTLADYANDGVFKKFQTALTEHPEANATAALYDNEVLGAIAPALQAAGRVRNFVVAGGEGYPANLQLMRADKGETAAFAIDITDVGYTIVDNLIRLFAHKKTVDEAVAVLLVDKQHNLSRVGKYYNGFFPYAKYYTSLWRKAGTRK
jgi:ribose transport system substrate-binding protein